MEFIYFKTNDAVATQRAKEFLPEGRQYSIDKKWSVRADKAHVPGMKDHNHIQLNGHDVAVVNRDGSPSHNTDASKVPTWVLGWLKDNKLTESYVVAERVPAGVIAHVIAHEESMTRAVHILAKMSGNGSS